MGPGPQSAADARGQLVTCLGQGQSMGAVDGLLAQHPPTAFGWCEVCALADVVDVDCCGLALRCLPVILVQGAQQGRAQVSRPPDFKYNVARAGLAALAGLAACRPHGLGWALQTLPGLSAAMRAAPLLAEPFR